VTATSWRPWLWRNITIVLKPASSLRVSGETSIDMSPILLAFAVSFTAWFLNPVDCGKHCRSQIH